MENLNSAIKKTKNDRNGIIIHSNHGSQYTSNIYKNFCNANGIVISMGKVYSCTEMLLLKVFILVWKREQFIATIIWILKNMF